MEVHMLNVGKIEEGFVLDHIPAGKGMSVYYHLGLDKLDCMVAIIKNAKSGRLGRKDIIKVECDIDTLNLDVLAVIDQTITVNVVKDGEILEKRTLELPKELTNVMHCKNPRCITSIEQEMPHIFYLAEADRQIYRCKYCDEKNSEKMF
jgi:aspartate carbamoyltransferase regulatory subunit